MADDLFRSDERAAWARYANDVRGLAADRYEEVEPWAWKRLSQALEAATYRLRGRAQKAAA